VVIGRGGITGDFSHWGGVRYWGSGVFGNWGSIGDWSGYFGNFGDNWGAQRFTVDDSVESMDWISGVFDGASVTISIGH
jgi:hypothetical protein